jgi:hypothetical protein
MSVAAPAVELTCVNDVLVAIMADQIAEGTSFFVIGPTCGHVMEYRFVRMGNSENFEDQPVIVIVQFMLGESTRPIVLHEFLRRFGTIYLERPAPQ